MDIKDEIVIASACRTPIGNFGGSFAKTNAVSLGKVVVSEAIKRAGIEPHMVDEVLLGCVLQAGTGQNIARQVSIYAGIPVVVPATTVNMVCGSGLKTICMAAQSIISGDADIIVAGGTENMSQAPYLLREMRSGAKIGDVKLLDSMICDALTDSFNKYHMGITAENIAEKYNIGRKEQDVYAAMSQQRAEYAQTEGLFKDEIIPVQAEIRKDESQLVHKDEYIHFGTTVEKLCNLRPAFKENGTVTAGNSSGINDGAAAVVIMSAKSAQNLGIKPIARILSYASSGIDPAFMGMGPVDSCKKALSKANLNMSDIELVEVNEAFAVQAIAVIRELGIDAGIVNVNGGAIALGHPVGASGARILVTLVYEMCRRNLRYGMATLCIGGGMGITIIVERENSYK